ncbi:hypothetical protein AMAG_07465 [Allomyces macrogynus ATCC 38327]|uniref:RING-type domain-containing protein n=1 Tax=Allomyces macrogynus (strain ATCC 38327) TaxID=578462 RepID=A0A0L0SIQ8_ALLM3|nr:hypothetical protein AMAG_07465 [Allomyces macrogynus ATCC 38327]|eukprot:KNE62225.1 hypothetical protein AMAG_07465 [Allomyces macrogynus ATCC 38327]
MPCLPRRAMSTSPGEAGPAAVTPCKPEVSAASAVNNDPACPICLDPLLAADGASRVTLPCLHAFCRRCIEAWALEDAVRAATLRPRCPLCKATFEHGVVDQVWGGVVTPKIKWALPVTVAPADRTKLRMAVSLRRPPPRPAPRWGTPHDPAASSSSSSPTARAVTLPVGPGPTLPPTDAAYLSTVPTSTRTSLALTRRRLVYRLSADPIPPSPTPTLPTGAVTRPAVRAFLARDLAAIDAELFARAEPVDVSPVVRDYVIAVMPDVDAVAEVVTPRFSRHLVDEVARFAASKWGIDAYDALVVYGGGVPRLVEMARAHSVEQTCRAASGAVEEVGRGGWDAAAREWHGSGPIGEDDQDDDDDDDNQ